MKGKGWVVCPKCKRRIFRWYRGKLEVAPGARITHPMDRVGDEWVPRTDEVAIAQCPARHWAGPPQP